jgi:poly-gamma-glutamate capsule biosynthesis protein CapA/YwtB (metallophosphatase superfamily)
MATLLACGDVGIRREQCASMLAPMSPLLQQADAVFGQLETTISARGAPVPNAKLAMRAPVAMAAAVRAAGFGVMSFAGNHCLDFGYEAFEDTLAHAVQAGLRLCGAGVNLAAAREPAMMDAAGVRIAVLAASAILPEGYAAEVHKPGCAPLRAHTIYEQIEHDQPGTPPRTRSFAHRADLEALVHRVRAARASADRVLVSLHWGIHMVPTVLADYQIEVAHALIEAGADAILGHHPHLLKGVEIYRGRPIFYSLGNFAIEQPHIWDPQIIHSASFRHLVSLNPSWNPEQTYMLPEITRATGLAKLIFQRSGAVEVRFLPAWIGDDSVPRPLRAADPCFARVRELLERSSYECGFALEIKHVGDELLLHAG